MVERSEKLIQQDVISTLRRMGHYVMRLNSGKYKMFNEAGKGRYIMGQESGTPDVMSIHQGKVYFWEVKRPGKKPTPIQEARMKVLEQYGAKCCTVTSVDDVTNNL